MLDSDLPRPPLTTVFPACHAGGRVRVAVRDSQSAVAAKGLREHWVMLASNLATVGKSPEK